MLTIKEIEEGVIAKNKEWMAHCSGKKVVSPIHFRFVVLPIEVPWHEIDFLKTVYNEVVCVECGVGLFACNHNPLVIERKAAVEQELKEFKAISKKLDEDGNSIVGIRKRKRKEVDEDAKNKFVSLNEQNLSISQIAKRTNYPPGIVKETLLELNIRVKYKKGKQKLEVGKDIIEKFSTMYKSGMGMPLIAKETGMPISIVARELKALGTVFRPKGRGRLKKAPVTTSKDEKLFAKLYKEGKTIANIKEETGFAVLDISNSLKAQKVELRPRGSWKRKDNAPLQKNLGKKGGK